MGLIARALENEGIAATLTGWNTLTATPKPPRAVRTNLKRGATLGAPHNVEQQKQVLTATLDLLAQDAPIRLVRMKFDEE